MARWFVPAEWLRTKILERGVEVGMVLAGAETIVLALARNQAMASRTSWAVAGGGAGAWVGLLGTP